MTKSPYKYQTSNSHTTDSQVQRVSTKTKQTRRTLWLVIPIAVLTIILVVVLANSESAFERRSSNPLIVGGLAPELTGVTTNGEDFNLDNWRGRWVIVNFFSTTCVPCIVEHPELIAFYEKHKEADDTRIVSVVFDDTVANVKEFFKTNGGDWPVLAEGASKAAISYGVTGVPESYLVAPSGVVVWLQLGGVTADAIDNVITTLETSAT